MVEKEGSLAAEARKETQEYIHHIGERVHKLQILAQKCYDAVKKFNEEIEDFVEEQPNLIAIDKDLRLIISFADPGDPDVKNPPQIL